MSHTKTLEKRMNFNELSSDAYRNLLNQIWKIELDVANLFPASITEWIRVTSKQLGVPFIYIAYPLITGVAHLLGHSTVKVTETYKEPIIIYTLISGRSGTNKSGSLACIRKLMEACCENCNIFDTGTMEGLMSQMRDNNGCVISMMDEFSIFFYSLDKNTSGNSERARFLSLWSAVPWSKRTKNSGHENVEDPRFQMTGFYQNYLLMNL